MVVRMLFPESGAAVDAELVFAGPDSARGLMGREGLSDSEGMLFDMCKDADHHFWMRGVLIPLDIIFVGSDDRVVGILPDMAPGDETRRGVGALSRRVLEVPGGWADRHRVSVGHRVTGGLS